MKRRIISPRGAALVTAALACLLLPSRAAFGQTAPPSDVLQTTATDPSSNNVVTPLQIFIPEAPAPNPEGITPISIPVPAQNFLFAHSTTASSPSDYLHIDPFNASVTSDSEQQLPLRPAAAKVIPSEVFLPVSIFATSDGNPSVTGTPSDRVEIFSGVFSGQPNPVPIFDMSIAEPTAETAAEDRLNFTTGPLFFDLLQPGSTSAVSDYLDLPNGLTGFFLSSDNPQDFASLPAPDGTIIEDPINGTTLHYSVGFASDTEVPEPSAIVLVGMASIGIVTLVGKRRLALARAAIVR
jgi:hypothetical protein